MSEVAQQAIRDFEPIGSALARALTRRDSTHGVLALYLRLLIDADDKAPPRSVEELGAQIGQGERTAARSLKVLRKLGVVRDAGKYLIVVTHTSDPRIFHILKGVDEGRGNIDVMKGTIAAVDDQAKTFDYQELKQTDIYDCLGDQTDVYDGQSRGLTTQTDVYDGLVTPEVNGARRRAVMTYPKISNNQPAKNSSPDATGGETFSIYIDKSRNTVSTSRSTSTRRNTNTLITNSNLTTNYDPTEKDERSVNWLPLSKKFHLPTAGFNHARDPYRGDIEAIQLKANQTFKVDQGVYGRDGSPNERYGIILRALHYYGLTRAELERAIENVLEHHFWGPKKVRDTIKLFRNQATVEELVNYVRPVGGKFDRRALDCAPVPAGTTIIGEEF